MLLVYWRVSPGTIQGVLGKVQVQADKETILAGWDWFCVYSHTILASNLFRILSKVQSRLQYTRVQNICRIYCLVQLLKPSKVQILEQYITNSSCRIKHFLTMFRLSALPGLNVFLPVLISDSLKQSITCLGPLLVHKICTVTSIKWINTVSLFGNQEDIAHNKLWQVTINSPPSSTVFSGV